MFDRTNVDRVKYFKYGVTAYLIGVGDYPLN